MAKLNKFTSVGVLSKFSPEYLVEFLNRFPGYLSSRSVEISTNFEMDSFDYEVIIPLFAQPGDDTPKALLEAAFFIEQMATRSGREKVIQEARARNIRLDYPPDLSVHDFILLTWLRHPALLEQAKSRLIMKRQRSFDIFVPLLGAVHPFVRSSIGSLSELERRLAISLPGCESGSVAVLEYDEGDEVWFLIRRGDFVERQGVMSASGSPDTIIFRPLRYDVVIYNKVHGVDGNITNAPVLASFSHLSPDSPCIGAGVYTNTSGTDIDGQAWLNPPSMGCDEYYGIGSVTGALQVAISGDTNVLVGYSLELLADIRGALYRSDWSFGDGTTETNNPVTSHMWDVAGSYNVVLTAFSDTYPSGVSATQTIHVLTLEESAIFVSTAGNDANDGSSWANSKATIQAGVDAQQIEHGLVLVDDGIYGVTNEIVVGKSITIQGVNGSESTIVDGGGSNRCFNLNSTFTILDGFTITNGFTTIDGGGVYCASSTPIITNCTIVGNTARNGGGIFKGTVYDSTIRGNTSTINGGGMRLSIVNNSIIRENSATGGGGGISGGVANNCSISGNTASWIGGGLNGSIASNCTIAQNKSDHIAGGIGRGAAYNCIIWHNQGMQLYNMTVSNSCCPEVIHGVDGNITNAPVLTSSSHISSDSPCRGAGAFSDASGTDFDGDAWQDPPSMGCDEYISGGVLLGTMTVGFEEGSRMAETNYALPLSASIEGAVSMHVWDFGDGEFATNRLNLVHSWSSSGSYDVKLTAYNDSNPSGISATQTISVVDAINVPVLHVSPTGNDASDGLSWATAKATIQAGVDAQPLEGGSVWLDTGTYSITNTIVVERGILIDGLNGAASTVVDGGGVVQCFQLRDGGSLKGLSVRNGKTTGVNGGRNQNTIVEDCLIYGNDGDGLYAAIVYNSAVTNNAGIGMNDCTAYNCLIANNVGGKGGGMEMSFNNGTTNWSGAAYNCIITNNTAQYGAGVAGGAAFNCLIADNHATDYGGGAADTLTVNCTIVGNTAANRGGGTYKNALSANVADENCIVYNNTAPQFPNMHTIATAINCCTPDVEGDVSGWVLDDPLFANAANGDYRLMSGSPCINWGNNAGMTQMNDLDGNPRIVEQYVDMGCFEFQGVVGLEGDQDENGYLDAWERGNFGGHVDPAADADGDGQSNADEYITGMDPTNGASNFAVSIGPSSPSAAQASEGTSVMKASAADASVGMILSWPAVTGRVYNVLWTPSLQESFQPLEIGIPYPVNSYTDTVHSAESSGYYRVLVMRADYDADGDGLPNDWENQYAVADAFVDEDHDGFNNMAEFISGTDPTNKFSFFTADNSVAEVNGTNCFVVEWISIPDRLYRVMWSTNLVTGFQTLEADIEFPQNSYTDTVNAVEGHGYYKVDVELK